ncbi:MAG: HPF/RaiA family ribosome-associated protein [Motiliproteus sp.]
MRIDIKSSGIELTAAQQAQISQHVARVLAQLKHRISKISLMLCEKDDPKGIIGKCCTVTLCSQGMENLVVSDTQAELNAAIERALQRINRTLLRRLKHDNHRANNGEFGYEEH